jgi:hypothetical protein
LPGGKKKKKKKRKKEKINWRKEICALSLGLFFKICSLCKGHLAHS